MPCLYVTYALNIKVVSQYDMYYVNNNRVVVVRCVLDESVRMKVMFLVVTYDLHPHGRVILVGTQGC